MTFYFLSWGPSLFSSVLLWLFLAFSHHIFSFLFCKIIMYLYTVTNFILFLEHRTDFYKTPLSFWRSLNRHPEFVHVWTSWMVLCASKSVLLFGVSVYPSLLEFFFFYILRINHLVNFFSIKMFGRLKYTSLEYLKCLLFPSHQTIVIFWLLMVC